MTKEPEPVARVPREYRVLEGEPEETHDGPEVVTGCSQCEAAAPEDIDAFPWDPAAIGTTCGGVKVRGAFRCPTCGVAFIGKASRPVDEGWKLAKGGRSFDAGAFRVRAEAGRDAGGARVEDLMARLVRLPDLEAALAEARRELDHAIEFPVALAARIDVLLAPLAPPPADPVPETPAVDLARDVARARKSRSRRKR